jgi:SecD/SecF fusion protein
VYARAGQELTTATGAALLTIMGYSLYDTIIVFDRIRENVPRMPRATFTQIANKSMSEVLTRSLATSFTVLMPVGALLLFGGETLKDFAFALLVGVASGAYSSIFIATPVLVEWKERELVYMRRRRTVMQEHGGLVPAFATGVIGEDGPAAAVAAEGAPARTPRRRRAARAAAAGGPAAPATPPSRATPPASQPAPPPPEPDPTPTRGQPAPPTPPTAGDGAGDGAGESRVTSTAGAGKPKQKPKRKNRQKKKHGRR